MTAGLLPPDIAAYDLLQSGAVWFDAPLRWSSFRGAKAMDVLNGLITNDVTALVTGATQAAVALTPKGKIVCDMVVLRADTESFFVGVHDLASTSWLDLVRKYVNPRLAVVTDESARYQTWYLLGASAAQVTGALEAADASSMHVPPRILRAPLPATAPAFLILAEHSDATEVLATLINSGAHRGSESLWTVARIEAGWPLWGTDMDENTIPQEANLDTLGAISFSKGCYTGQETVARIHFRGHVNRHLRGLLSEIPLERGASVVDATGKVVGDVRSAATSPRLGPIALAMVRRELTPGDRVQVMVHGAFVEAQMIALPFAPRPLLPVE